MSIQSAANALVGDVSGNKILCPGPGHSKYDRSMSVKIDPAVPDGFLVHSFAGDHWQDCRDYVKDRLGIERHPEPSSNTTAPLNLAPVTKHAIAANDYPGQHSNTQAAKRIWQEAQPVAGSPVEKYLSGRNLANAGICFDALRYHPNCPFKGETVPAMVAKMTDIITNEFRGIHRTRLNPKDKAMLGTAKGSVVKLSPDDEVTTGLHISEGIETGLALMDAGFKPLWAALSANGIAKFPVPPGIECLTVFSDNDANQTGQNAARECAARWQAAGEEVSILITPETGSDFADWRQL